MADPKSEKGVSTTPADLLLGIDAALRRCFDGIDLEDEARSLGLEAGSVRELGRALLDLRDIAARAVAAGSGR